MNAFPQYNFSQSVVKRRVYSPTWAEAERTEFTLACIGVLDGVLPPGLEGSISTLPLGWGRRDDVDFERRTAQNLKSVCEHLAKLEADTGRCIYLCLEPEPGCTLTTSSDVISFFDRHVFQLLEREMACRYLRICHDICHAAVMFEVQSDVVKRYHEAGLQIGKVQISSAIDALLLPSDAADSTATNKKCREALRPVRRAAIPAPNDDLRFGYRRREVL